MSPSPDLAPLIDRWVAAGIISTEQADRIRADVASSPPQAARGSSLVVEAMGYLGGVIVLVGLGLLVGWVWEDLSPIARIALAGGVAAVLLGAGAAVPTRLGPAGSRLRAILWSGTSIALFACLGLVADNSLHWESNDVLLVAATGTTVVSAVLWALHRRLPQHIVLLLALLIAVGALTGRLTEPYPWVGLAIWGVGVVWFGLSWLGVLPRQAGTALGAISAGIGAVVIEGEQWGTVLALVTVAALVAAAVALRDLLVLAIASVGTLIVLPITVDQYFPGVLPVALTLVGVGLVLVVLAVFVARRRRGQPSPTAP